MLEANLKDDTIHPILHKAMSGTACRMGRVTDQEVPSPVGHPAIVRNEPGLRLAVPQRPEAALITTRP